MHPKIGETLSACVNVAVRVVRREEQNVTRLHTSVAAWKRGVHRSGDHKDQIVILSAASVIRNKRNCGGNIAGTIDDEGMLV